MEKLDFWRLCDELSVVQAALLIVGVDPAEFPYVMGWEEHKRPEKFSAALAALSHAIRGGRIPATLRTVFAQEWDGVAEVMFDRDTGQRFTGTDSGSTLLSF